jgi:hypothetical protein
VEDGAGASHGDVAPKEVWKKSCIVCADCYCYYYVAVARLLTGTSTLSSRTLFTLNQLQQLCQLSKINIATG